MALKSEAIKAFLNAKTHADLAKLYSKELEVQVNVNQGDGQRIDVGSVTGKPGFAFSDGIENWQAYRIPRKAMSEPEDNDGPQSWNLDKHVEGIGLTGWDWKNRKSRWVAYDFDAMLGHSDKHSKKLTDAQMQEVHDVVTKLPFVTLRRSTSGKGLHLYIFLEPIDTANHTEHAALARSILSYMAGITGFNFTEKVDICGGNMWVWHRKMLGTNGLSLIRAGEVFPAARVPTNWRDHLTVISRRSTRVLPKMGDKASGAFEELSGQRSKVKLDEDHRRLINWLVENNLPGWWDADNHTLVSHTYYLKRAHQELRMRGEFHTDSTGREEGHDINCFAFPTRGGAWAIRRYGQGTKEHKSWMQDGKTWTRTYLNRELSLDDVARMFDAIELEKGGYQFPSTAFGKQALLKLGIELETAKEVDSRIMAVKENRQDCKLVITIPTVRGDNFDMKTWLMDRGYYRRVVGNPRVEGGDEVVQLGDYDDTVRHLISDNNDDCGWVICSGVGEWRYEPLQHVKLLLKSKGISSKDVEGILGQAINHAWTIVNKPFEPEYPGDRQWNRSSARFKVSPTLDGEILSFPTWQKVLDHCGNSLTLAIQKHNWCKQNGVTTGGEYLKLWLASLVKHPQSPLPYLAFHGPQDSGKSTFHEAFCQLILDGGYMDGALALNSQGSFNGELQDSILCTLEEVDLRDKKIYQRVKDWVTSAQISIHVKGQTPYKAPNYTHWVQCVNDRDFIPTFPGDTRIVVSHVPSLSDDRKIPKRDLWTMLTKEAPDFLASLLSTEIPDSKDRLMLPVINTADKIEAVYQTMDRVQQFFADRVKNAPGAYVKQDDLYRAFQDYIGIEEQHGWSKSKFDKARPQDIPKGRLSHLGPSDQANYYGNITLEEPKPEGYGSRWLATGTYMRREESLLGTKA